MKKIGYAIWGFVLSLGVLVNIVVAVVYAVVGVKSVQYILELVGKDFPLILDIILGLIFALPATVIAILAMILQAI